MRSARRWLVTGTLLVLLALAASPVRAEPPLAGPTPGVGAAPAASAARLTFPLVYSARPQPAPQPAGEIRALWVSRYDWTVYRQRPTANDVQRIVDDAARAGFNTIIFQVRGAGDAYYTPGLEPWAARLTGTSGKSLGENPGWDPLAEMISRAHARGIAVHAWMNVYPAWQAPAAATGESNVPRDDILPPAPLYRMSWAWVDGVAGYGLGNAWRAHDINGPMSDDASPYLYASPNCIQWQDHVAAVAADIVSRYALDGLHLDNVRFPSVAYSLDPALQQACAADPGCPSVHDDAWRGNYQRAQVTNLVRRITQQTHALRPGCLVSAAVMPVYLNRWGWTTMQAYSDYYQDSEGWLERGDVDALAPMAYTNTFYNTKWSDRTFTFALDRWSTTMADHRDHSGGRAVLPGIGVTYLERCVSFEDIQRQIETARSLGLPGFAVFSLSGLRDCGYIERLGDGPNR